MTAAAHPSWCDGTEPTIPPSAHLGQVGADIELSAEHVMFVDLMQVEDRPTTIGIGNHTPDETSVTRLSLVQAAILRDLLSEALGLVAREAGLGRG
ncbi:hypothetical protein ABT369_05340 [Dactylosporangium sp. NPDC000244]|uniref:hypothetical protein n=1 Tax=Dactylosporangium sp. NPDC000244 TaxID=3154365 RepID=UPI00332CCAAC